jgi:hypothetical protein
MGPQIIYQGEGWTVTQDPTMAGRPDLVRFHRNNGQRKLLDQVAQWNGIAWAVHRWMPKLPTVPQWLIDKVVAHLREVQP